MVLSCIKGEKYIIESYMYGRCDGSIKINSENGREHWDYLKEQDAVYLKKTGLAEVLQKHDAQYINISEEYWSGRCVETEKIKALVEKKFSPLYHQEFYGFIPQRLFEKRHLPMISLAKIKYNVPRVSNFSTLSMKNMFGLIPLPNREKYHGADFEKGLSRSIVNILTVYAAIFKIIGINEGLFQMSVTREPGKNTRKMIWTEYDVIENQGMILGAEDLVTLDGVTNHMIGLDPESRSILKIGEEVFGRWERKEKERIPEAFKQVFAQFL
ncbi:uncharacterized protein DUF362 [Ruminiclostridium sufflavum DSM 19573]|uniref:Uncharacterized protein DUF362 n=2 Tax=Ruminiclostridium TaxID=1508657 RepID=A0A318XKI2_9FIRM|nr:uncharacterized protein DUF362 [Ruminiclostridium sufflavum DSM 19573]